MPRKKQPELKKFKVTISDTVTYARTTTVIVQAKDEDAAKDIGHTMATNFVYAAWVTNEDGLPFEARSALVMDEDQIDNTPWEVEVEEAP